jgi:hypothetical protein
MSSLQLLQTRYPYMFANLVSGPYIARGWYPVFEELCEAVDQVLGADKHGFHWIQIKEKFGTARLYFAMDGHSPHFLDLLAGQDHTTPRDPQDPDEQLASVSQQLSALIEAAMLRTHSLCILCGAPGKLDEHDGYWLTVCPQHAKDRLTGRFKQLWLNMRNDPS